MSETCLEMDVNDMAETRQELHTSAPETGVVSNDNKSYEYQIPEWFSKGNIKTPADLAGIKPRMVHFSSHDSPREPNADDDRVPFDIRYDQFSQLSDTTSAALVRNADGDLPFELPSVLMRTDVESSIEKLNEIAMHLAKDIGATLISIDLEDLEDLSYEFKRQDENHSQMFPNEDDTESSISEKSDAQYYFVVRSERHASRSAWLRVNRAISTIINTARVNSQAYASAISTADDISRDLPIILHVQNLNTILAKDEKSRSLARLRNFAQEYRKAGGNLVLLATYVVTGDTACSDDCEETMMRKMGICGESCLYIRPDIRRGIKLPDSYSYFAMANTRRLKRFLRRKLANSKSMDFLHPSSDWGHLGNECGGYFWSESNIKQATQQLAGRTLKKPTLDLDDIEIVLRRLLLTIKLPKDVETVQDDKADKSRAWKEKIHHVKCDCNSSELKLVSSIVNPANLESTFDDVIIDSESKETMRYLVSMSNFCPDAKSSYLLSQIRINGALLYGPPGTGKTHLSRAVAKDSGMNMIAIDSASVTSKWSGETETYIKASFTLASKLFPCVLFIDEVDALFYRRDSDDKSWQRSALTQFLQCLDGLVKDDKAPFVIVATNRPLDLDDAFLRRLPQKLFFKLPDEESRLKILRLFLKDEDIHESLDVEGLAKLTEGYSGSDIRSLCGKAAMIWTIEQGLGKDGDTTKEKPKLCLEARHFVKALQSIRPSVSERSLAEFAKFAKQYNTNDFEASYTIDEECLTKSVVASNKTNAANTPDGGNTA